VHEYDTTLKAVLERLLPGSVLADWVGVRVARWRNVELPDVRTRRVDMLGETTSGDLLHIELQSRNDSDMAFRLAEYSLAIRRRYGVNPRQMVLYVGQQRMRMPATLLAPGWSYSYELVDIRQIDAQRLLASSHLEDNIMAVLARLPDRRMNIRTILQRIEAAGTAEQERAIAELSVLAGLRGLGHVIKWETRTMPITESMLNHDLFGPKIREGMAKGRIAGERRIVQLQITRRFGKLPDWASKRLRSLTIPEIEKVALQMQDAARLEDLLG
jgi:hypothetical protein